MVLVCPSCTVLAQDNVQLSNSVAVVEDLRLRGLQMQYFSLKAAALGNVNCLERFHFHQDEIKLSRITMLCFRFVCAEQFACKKRIGVGFKSCISVIQSLYRIWKVWWCTAADDLSETSALAANLSLILRNWIIDIFCSRGQLFDFQETRSCLFLGYELDRLVS